MRRKLSFLVMLFACALGSARQNLDETLVTVSTNICERCADNDILAILDFSSDSKAMSEYLVLQLTSLILENSKLRVVTRQHLNKLDEELDFQYSGSVSDETVLSLCERLGAKRIIFGQFDELDNAYMLQVKMIDVDTAAYSLFKKYEVQRSSKTEQLLNHAAKIYKSSFGFIFEINKNSIANVSPAVGISFDYNLTRKFSLGIKTIASFDLFENENTIVAIEPLGFLRWYAVSPSGEPNSGIFIEGQGGADLIFVNSELKTVASGGGAVGYRFVNRLIYIDISLRGGYPYMFGAGVNLGFRF